MNTTYNQRLSKLKQDKQKELSNYNSKIENTRIKLSKIRIAKIKKLKYLDKQIASTKRLLSFKEFKGN